MFSGGFYFRQLYGIVFKVHDLLDNSIVAKANSWCVYGRGGIITVTEIFTCNAPRAHNNCVRTKNKRIIQE
jgi:hypothetical protein